jgi:predicted nucleotidyltransferase
MPSAQNSKTDVLAAPVFSTARTDAEKQRQKLDDLLSREVARYGSEDTSLVVFGSLARGEWTRGSDLDWTYLVDGQANSDHLVIAQRINGVLRAHKDEFRSPGQTGTFGNMAFSHELIHQIGGQSDTNKNMTQRILLLLESVPIGNATQAYDRVIKGVINRYLEEDTHLLTRDGKRYRVPRFLLNDIVRFWRTMAVDFASKQRDREGEGWGIRNAKLRMSRKLIFASGLLVCFGCHLDRELNSEISTEKDVIRLKLVNHIRDYVKLTPLEILAKSVQAYGLPSTESEQLFSAYAEFLHILDDADARKGLQELRAKNSENDRIFNSVRSMSARFQRALDSLFFDNKEVAPLARKYAVF